MEYAKDKCKKYSTANNNGCKRIIIDTAKILKIVLGKSQYFTNKIGVNEIKANPRQLLITGRVLCSINPFNKKIENLPILL